MRHYSFLIAAVDDRKKVGEAYVPPIRKMKDSEGDAKTAARKQLLDATTGMERLYLPVVATEKAKLAVLGTGQPEQGKDKGKPPESDADYKGAT